MKKWSTPILLNFVIEQFGIKNVFHIEVLIDVGIQAGMRQPESIVIINEILLIMWSYILISLYMDQKINYLTIQACSIYTNRRKMD